MLWALWKPSRTGRDPWPFIPQHYAHEACIGQKTAQAKWIPHEAWRLSGLTQAHCHLSCYETVPDQATYELRI